MIDSECTGIAQNRNKRTANTHREIDTPTAWCTITKTHVNVPEQNSR